MSNSSEAVKRWRMETKKTAVNAMGGKCAICGYCRCADALDFHHIDDTNKSFGVGKIMGNPTSWARIVTELKKCVLLCANCHRELHAGLIKLPDRLPVFNPTYTHYSRRHKTSMTPCVVCGKSKPACRKTCSKKCAASLSWTVDWHKHDVIRMVETQQMAYTAIADLLGVSSVAVWKRYKRVKSGK